MHNLDDETMALLRLTMCEGIGDDAVHRLVDTFGSAGAVMEASRSDLTRVQGLGNTLAERITTGPPDERVDKELDLMDRARTRLLPFHADDYPLPLKQLGRSAPPLLRIRGEYSRDDMLSVAIVGSRNCTHYGRSQARRFGMALSGYGFTIISGLARGIDTEAHRAAVQANGRTIALMGCGLARIDTVEDPELALSITENGALISELSMEAPPLPRHFPPRNRLISGLALGVLVVQAGRKSGSLISARWAGEQGKDIFAIPGQVNSPASHGCHQLIRDGALLVEKPAEVLDDLGPLPEEFRQHAKNQHEDIDTGGGDSEKSHAVSLTDNQEKVLELLGSEPRQIDDIIDETGMSPPVVSSALLTMEIKGLVEKLSGQRYVLRNR